MGQSKISTETREQVKIAYAAGAGLREIARKMNIPEGTVLAHAKRKDWTQQIQEARDKIDAIKCNHAVAGYGYHVKRAKRQIAFTPKQVRG